MTTEISAKKGPVVVVPLRGFQIVRISPSDALPNPRIRRCYLDLEVHGLGILRGFSLQRDLDNYNWALNDSGSSFRILDSPAFRDLSGRRGPSLDTEIYRYLQEMLSGDLGQALAELLTESASQLPRFPLYIPPAWRERALMLPIEFIALRNLYLNSADELFTDIQLGQQIILWCQKIGTPSGTYICGTGLYHPLVTERIAALIQNPAVTSAAPHFSGQDWASNHTFVLTDPPGVDWIRSPVLSLSFKCL